MNTNLKILAPFQRLLQGSMQWRIVSRGAHIVPPPAWHSTATHALPVKEEVIFNF